jgi:UDP-N-acetylglucosamine:LPS N-acetylglucosamine transferase
LILTAPVGGGHDAAARAVARELEERGYEPVIANALRRSGRWVEWLIVRGYQFQLRRAPWSYELMYRVLKRRLPSRFIKWLPGFVGARSIRKLCDEVRPALIVTTYHLAGAMLSRLRRQGRLAVPAAAIITDLAPHPMWCYPRLDAHLTMDDRSAQGFGAMAKAPTLSVRPPIDPAFGRADRAAGRASLGLAAGDRAVAVVGGAWGTGRLGETVRACAQAGWRAVVVTGRNDELRRRLSAEAPPKTVVLGFVDDMPTVLGACDAVIVNAPGLTCLEAFASRVPVLIHDPIPGHGRHNARYMEECGLVMYPRSSRDLVSALRRLADDARPLQIARASRLFEGRRCAEVIASLHATPPPRRHRAAVAVLIACLIPALTTTRVGVASASDVLRRHVVEPGGHARDVALCVRFGHDLSHQQEAMSLLRRAGANATFFVSSEDAGEHPAFVRSLAGNGNEVGNGGDGRAIFIPLARRSDRRASDRLRFITGSSPLYAMPAAGRVTLGQVLSASRERPVLGAVGIDGRTLGRLRPGEIFVVDLSRPDGLARISALLAAASSDDLRVVDLTELLAARGGSAA